MKMYTEEVKEIQELLSGKRRLSDSEISMVKAEVGGKQIPNFLAPFLGLVATHQDLYKKILD